MDMETFIERHKGRLFEYLESASPALIANPEVDAFVSRLEEEMRRVEGLPPGQRKLLPGEDTFLWCVDQLAMVADPHSGYSAADPWACHMIADLKALAPRLRARQPLPPGRQLHFLPPMDDDPFLDDPFLDDEYPDGD